MLKFYYIYTLLNRINHDETNTFLLGLLSRTLATTSCCKRHYWLNAEQRI